MKKRMFLMLLAVAVFVAVIGSVKLRELKSSGAQGASFQPPPEAVTTVVAGQEVWPVTIRAIGTVVASQGVTVSADLPGIVEKISFSSGRPVQAGEVLVQLDTSQERAQLAAAEAQRDLARLNLERLRELSEQGIISRSDYDRAAAETSEGEARVGEVRATIERKIIRAPFAGLLGIRKVNLGQYLAGGDPVVPLQSLRPVFVSFSVPQQVVGRLRSGTPVKVAAEGQDAFEPGSITAVDSIVDEATRNVEVQATFANREGRLRPGMFVEVQVDQSQSVTVIPLPASAISYAPYGDSVYIVEDMKGPDGKSFRGVRQQFVTLGSARGDQVAVASGVKPGEEVVSSGAFKLRNGAAVQVNNSVRPSNSPKPRPEDS